MTYEEFKEKVGSVILTDDGNCPVTPVVQMLQGKWKLQILYERFSSIFAIIASLQYIFSYWNVLAANVNSRFENRRFSKPSIGKFVCY